MTQEPAKADRASALIEDAKNTDSPNVYFATLRLFDIEGHDLDDVDDFQTERAIELMRDYDAAIAERDAARHALAVHLGLGTSA